MTESWFSCKGCSSSDPAQDTVKFDASLLDKENAKPPQQLQSDEKQKREAEEKAAKRQQQEVEAARKREEAERKKKEEAARIAAQEAEAARLKAEEEARQYALRMEEEKRHKEERARAEAAAFAAEEARKQAEAEAAARKAKVAAIELDRRVQEAGIKVKEWCKKNGYKDPNTQKTTYSRRTKFPLHTAVKHSNVEIVEDLLLLGAKKDVKDSQKQTPSELASKINTNGSHDQIVALLA